MNLEVRAFDLSAKASGSQDQIYFAKFDHSTRNREVTPPDRVDGGFFFVSWARSSGFRCGKIIIIDTN